MRIGDYEVGRLLTSLIRSEGGLGWLPFVSAKAKHDSLDDSTARLFNLLPRTEKQCENLVEYGNLPATA